MNHWSVGHGKGASAPALAAPLVFLTLATGSTAPIGDGTSTLPPRLERYLTDAIRLSSAERQRLVVNQPVAKLLDSDVRKEVAVFGAI